MTVILELKWSKGLIIFVTIKLLSGGCCLSLLYTRTVKMLPTPSDSDGSVHTNIIWMKQGVFHWISEKKKRSKFFWLKFFLHCPSKSRRVVDVYLNLCVLIHFDISFLIHNMMFMFVLVAKVNLIICWWLIKKKVIFEMYQHYLKPLNYAPLKFKNNCHIYAFIRYCVHKTKKIFSHR